MAAFIARIKPATGWRRPDAGAIYESLRRFRPQFGRLEWIFLLIALVAAGMRLWELDGRTMHYDEAIHLHFAWKLAQGTEFAHSPWMHGPLQVELVAAVLRFIGDTDFMARLPYALFGVVLVMLPYLLRKQIGDKGAVGAAVILAFSPSLLYFSRFGRNDILMAVWALLLLILLWRCTERSRKRYLYGAAAVTALMLATKETAYFVILFMGIAALGLGWRQLWGVARRRQRLAEAGGAAGFFILLATLTLPQAAAIISLAQGPLGLTLAAHDTGATGSTGAPVWEAPFATLPAWEAPLWVGAAAAGLLLAGRLALAWRRRRAGSGELLAMAVAIAASATATGLAVARPFYGLIAGPEPTAEAASSLAAFADRGIALFLVWVAIAALKVEGASWRRIALVVGATVLLAWLWLTLFWGGLPYIAPLSPDAAADIADGRIAVNYLVPVLALLALCVAGAAAGVAWGGGVWLGCAGVFYAVWLTLYTTAFTNWAGVFTGSWQGLGYWLAQQEVARGNQPWYYYAIGLTVYELLALVFGLAAVVWLLRRREPFGIVLAAWAVATLAIYTIAAEKMPWLLVNITVPLALTAGTLLGHLADRIPWAALGRRRAALLVLAPAWLAMAVWVAWLAARGDAGVGAGSIAAGLAGLVLLPTAVLTAWLMRGQPQAGKAAALGIAGLLLLFGTAAAVRAAYTYDDSNLEILVYAQGASDLPATYDGLRRSAPADAAEAGRVKVDYDMWYPFQWYVRAETESGSWQFDRFCAANGEDEPEGCRKVGADSADGAPPYAYLAEHANAVSEKDADAYRKDGPLRNLLWYPETYRRPGESRTDTGMWQQLAADIAFFRDTAANPDKWRQALEYIVVRRQQSDWFTADYYQYTREQAPQIKEDTQFTR